MPCGSYAPNVDPAGTGLDQGLSTRATSIFVTGQYSPGNQKDIMQNWALLLDGMGDGLFLGVNEKVHADFALSSEGGKVSGRNYFSNHSMEQFLNTTAFGILQATRTRISKTYENILLVF